MIRIKPAWEGEQAEDVLALYDFLLYQTLPLDPALFLPMDGEKPYYHENGDRNGRRIYPTESGVKWKMKKGTCIFLGVLEKEGKIPVGSVKNAETMIKFASPELYAKLYETATGLRDLLLTRPTQDRQDIRKIKVNPELPEFENELLTMLYNEIFNYDKFSSRPLFPKLVQMLGVTVCPYCNRAFTSTVKNQNGTYHRSNQIDHYAPKKLYPWLALSLPNLIPSCPSCNQKKGETEDVLYPYEEGFGDAYRFRTVPVSGLGYLSGQPASLEEFRVELSVDEKNTTADYRQRAEKSRSVFGLDSLYRETHNAYVAEIFRQRYVFNDAYVSSLSKSFPALFPDEASIRHMLYMRSIHPDELDQSPLAKLTRDIDEEISGDG